MMVSTTTMVAATVPDVTIVATASGNNHSSRSSSSTPITTADHHHHLTNKNSSKINNQRSLIVNGVPVLPNETLYRPAFAYVEGIGCGGILIHSDIVLSAGHCFYDRNVIGRNIFLGSTQRNGSDAIVTIPVAAVRIHPWYSVYDFSMNLTKSVNISDTVENADYDYAILKLLHPVTNITPIPYNTDSGTPVDNTTLLTMGYGLTSQNGTFLSSTLLQVYVQAININTCSAAYNNELDTVSTLCAAAPDKDACNGDSGGPLLQITQTNTTTSTSTPRITSVVVVGIVSGGIGCAQRQFPGIYARVSVVANDFIFQTICQLSDDTTSLTNCPTPVPSPPPPQQQQPCNSCYKNPYFGLRFGLGTQMYFINRRRRGDDVRCEERCHYNWLLWYWKFIGWKCGICPI
jgi:secreted trypsin-like serine protease